MIQIKVKPLCHESFRKYGTFQNLLDNESLAKNSVNPAGFFPDLIELNFGTTTLPSSFNQSYWPDMQNNCIRQTNICLLSY